MGAHRQAGFTLVELLVVGLLISLFSTIAIFNMQRFFDDSKRKAVFDEVKSLGTALSFAYDDIGFYPRLHLLSLPRSLVVDRDNSGQVVMRPGFDTYGFLGAFSTPARNIFENWSGSYMGVSEARTRLAQGQKGLVPVRLPDTSGTGSNFGGDDNSLVNWPTDVWGNPYVIYLVRSDASLTGGLASNPKGLFFIQSYSDDPDFMVAVVSYGPNGIPGGSVGNGGFLPDPASADYANLRAASLFVEGDLVGTEAAFTLRAVNSTDSSASFLDANFANNYPDSITHSNPDISVGRVGILDTGSDDIVWKF
jgi:prepilin-type N-terminal cleavage/methylation domain-containing protein